MTVTETKLSSGDRLAISVLHPPLGEYAQEVATFADIRDELLAGAMTEWLYTPFYIGEIDGEVAGSLACYTPRDTRDVGMVEFVQTAEKHRRKGVSSALLEAMMERFEAEGGQALYLSTVNPVAGIYYEKYGFRYHTGHGMQYLSHAAGDFEKRYLAFDGAARVRPAHWGDMPRAVVLYNHPEPAWIVKDYLTRSFHDSRVESQFANLMKRTENRKGAVLVLETPKRRVVGIAAMERFDSYYQQHVATLSFRVSPAYFEEAPRLLDGMARRAEELAVRVLQVYVADPDRKQRSLLREAGFAQEARLRDRLRVEDSWADLLVYTRSVPGGGDPWRQRSDYYGGKQPWQAERSSSLEMERPS